MKVVFYLGEPFWRAVGQRQVEAQVEAPATVAQALAALAQAYPALAADLQTAEAVPAVFVDDQAAEPGQLVPPGARLHVVWPVSGG